MDGWHLSPQMSYGMLLGPQNGKHSAGGQKKRWWDVIISDLKICDRLHDWHETTLERAVWRALVNEAVKEVNHSMGKKK